MKKRSLLLSLALLPLAVAPAFAADDLRSTGLGQAWPNAPDVSISPYYHVYVFERSGLRYIQVNDLGGTVRAAVVSAGDDVVGLPIGVDASRLATPSEPANALSGTTGTTVYVDAKLTLIVSPQSDGTATLRAMSAGECTNPRECSVGSH